MAKSNELKLAVLPGDGIGPEITDATITVLKAAARRTGLKLTMKKGLFGWDGYKKHKTTIPDSTIKLLGEHEGWIVGPTYAGEYPKDDPYHGHPNGFIRKHFKLFANVRPVESFPQLKPLIPDLNIVVLRENTEGFYPDRNMAWGYGEFKPTDDVAISMRVITRKACERFARFSFAYAEALGINRISVVHKRTALQQSDGLFVGTFEEINKEFKKTKLELLRIDTFSSQFPREPHKYKLVATTNLFGDILSDQASGLAGGVGVAPSLNAGTDCAMAQAVHGTAPDLVGKGVANPSALIFSTALLCRWFYLRTKNKACLEAASLMEKGVKTALVNGVMTPDLGGKASSATFTKAIVSAINNAK